MRSHNYLGSIIESRYLDKIEPLYSILLMSLQDNLFGLMEFFNLQACDTGILLVGWQV